MSTVKEQLRQLLDRLPDDVTLEDIQYQLYVRQKVELGLNDLAAGRLLEQSEIEKRVEQWIDKVADTAVVILGIVHGARELQSVWRDEGRPNPVA